MKELIFVRHGEAESNVDKHGIVGSDSGLTLEGIRQMEATAEYLGSLALWGAIIKPALIYSSPYVRAQESAEILSASLHLPMQTDARLQEVQKGTWHGMKVADVVKLEDEVTAERRPYFRAPEGENWFDMADRMSQFVQELVDSGDESALVVSHNHPIEVAVGKLCGMAVSEWEKFPVDNASVSRLLWEHASWRRDETLYNVTPYR